MTATTFIIFFVGCALGALAHRFPKPWNAIWFASVCVGWLLAGHFDIL